MDTPYALLQLEEAASTQDEARRRYDGSPFLVVSSRQTAGRGRGGSTWETAPRALAASLAFASDWPTETWGRVPLVAGMSLRAVLPILGELKWPNDLVREGAKIAGILVEGSEELMVVGVGVNLWWPDGPKNYGAVFEEDPGPDAHSVIAGDWATAFLDRLAGGPDLWGREEYRRVCTTLGRRITWEPAGVGEAIDVDHDGALVVQTATGVERLLSGNVWELRDLDASR